MHNKDKLYQANQNLAVAANWLENTEALNPNCATIINSVEQGLAELDCVAEKVIRDRSEIRELKARISELEECNANLQSLQSMRELSEIPSLKLPSDFISRFSNDDKVVAMRKAGLVASGFNECRELLKTNQNWIKTMRGES
jgi:cell shape-determining protein MreC